MSKIRVLVADDHEHAVLGLREMILSARDMQYLGHAESPSKVIELVRNLEPDVIVLDIKWGPDRQMGLSLSKEIASSFPKTKVVAISAYADLLEPARSNGAFRVLEKGFSKAELLEAIRWTMGGHTHQVSGQYGAGEEIGLTSRERQALEGVAEGKTDKQIAKALGVSALTVKKHVSNAKQKLGAANRAQAALRAKELGFIQRKTSDQ